MNAFLRKEVWDSLQARSANYLSRLRAFFRQTDDAIGLLEQDLAFVLESCKQSEMASEDLLDEIVNFLLFQGKKIIVRIDQKAIKLFGF